MPYIEYIGTTNVRRSLGFFMYGRCDKERIPCQSCKQSFFCLTNKLGFIFSKCKLDYFCSPFSWEKMAKFFILKTLREKKIPLQVSLGIIACFYLLPKVQQLFYESGWTIVIKLNLCKAWNMKFNF